MRPDAQLRGGRGHDPQHVPAVGRRLHPDGTERSHRTHVPCLVLQQPGCHDHNPDLIGNTEEHRSAATTASLSAACRLPAGAPWTLCTSDQLLSRKHTQETPAWSAYKGSPRRGRWTFTEDQGMAYVEASSDSVVDHVHCCNALPLRCAAPPTSAPVNCTGFDDSEAPKEGVRQLCKHSLPCTCANGVPHSAASNQCNNGEESCSKCNPGYALQDKSCVPAIGVEFSQCNSTPAPADVNGTLCAATRGLDPQAQCQPDGAPMCSMCSDPWRSSLTIKALTSPPTQGVTDRSKLCRANGYHDLCSSEEILEWLNYNNKQYTNFANYEYLGKSGKVQPSMMGCGCAGQSTTKCDDSSGCYCDLSGWYGMTNDGTTWVEGFSGCASGCSMVTQADGSDICVNDKWVLTSSEKERPNPGSFATPSMCNECTKNKSTYWCMIDHTCRKHGDKNSPCYSDNTNNNNKCVSNTQDSSGAECTGKCEEVYTTRKTMCNDCTNPSY